jgi:hypothetical protein
MQVLESPYVPGNGFTLSSFSGGGGLTSLTVFHPSRDRDFDFDEDFVDRFNFNTNKTLAHVEFIKLWW